MIQSTSLETKQEQIREDIENIFVENYGEDNYEWMELRNESVEIEKNELKWSQLCRIAWDATQNTASPDTKCAVEQILMTNKQSPHMVYLKQYVQLGADLLKCTCLSDVFYLSRHTDTQYFKWSLREGVADNSLSLNDLLGDNVYTFLNSN